VADRRSWLQRLDHRLVPRVRGVVRSVGGVLGRPFVALVAWERGDDRPTPVRRVAAHPAGVALLAAVIVFAGSVLHLQRFDVDEPAGAGDEQAVTREGEQAPAEVGPRIGADLDLYVEGRRAALRDLDEELDIRAVVSFHDYLGADDLDLPTTLELERLELRIPIEGERPRTLEVDREGPDDEVAGIVAAQVADLEEEEAELRSLLDSDVDDPEFEEEYERRAEEIEEVRTSLEDDAAIVFAVVVTGPVAELVDLDATPDVRLVDPVGSVPETASTRLFGLLPDDLERASHGRAL
jgi:hypothetical protein